MTSTAKQKKTRHGQEYWKRHVTGWQQSGLTRAAYCEKHSLSLQTFAYWRKRLKTNTPAVTLVQIPAKMSPLQSESSPLRIEFSNGVTIVTPDGFNESTLASVIEVVRRL